MWSSVIPTRVNSIHPSQNYYYSTVNNCCRDANAYVNYYGRYYSNCLNYCDYYYYYYYCWCANKDEVVYAVHVAQHHVRTLDVSVQDVRNDWNSSRDKFSTSYSTKTHELLLCKLFHRNATFKSNWFLYTRLLFVDLLICNMKRIFLSSFKYISSHRIIQIH